MIMTKTTANSIISCMLGLILILHSPLSANTAGTQVEVDPHTIVSDGFLMGKFNADERKYFVRINKRYASRDGMYMQKLPYDAFRAMHAEAKKEGISLKILSALRSFGHQKSIWEAKWNGKRRVGSIRNIKRSIKDPIKRAFKILEYSSMPGSSRHHWGTDIDLNDFTNRYFEQGYGKKVYAWLVKNAPRYGFCQTDNIFTGFRGSNTATRIGIIDRYVLGIHPNCY